MQMPASFGFFGPGESTIRSGYRLNFFNGNLVVSDNFDIGVKNSDILIQVISKRIIVINQQNHKFSSSISVLASAITLLQHS